MGYARLSLLDAPEETMTITSTLATRAEDYTRVRVLQRIANSSAGY